MSRYSQIAAATTVFLSLAFCNVAAAALISWDFNASAAHNAGPPTTPLMVGPVSAEDAGAFGTGFGHAAGVPWNSVNLGPTLGSFLTGSTSGPMQTDAGVATGVTWTATSGNHAYFTSGADNDLRRDVIFLQSGFSGNSLGWEISGLVPGNLYDIKIFGQLDATNGPPVNAARHAITGANGVFGPTDSNTVATFLSVEALFDGRITGLMTNLGVSSMSGMQIQGDFPAPITPEPSSIVLAVLGLCGLAARRTRRK